MRDHEPVVIDQFNGLYKRGDEEDTPLDHFSKSNNIRFKGESSFSPRSGVGISQNVAVPLSNVKRIYNYPTLKDNTLIVLTIDPVTGDGEIFHVVNPTTVFGPILTIAGMEDFAFQPYAGRGYISPFATLGEFTSNPGNTVTLALDSGAGVNAGVHQYAYTFVTATGETSPSALASITVLGELAAPVTTPVISVGPSQAGNAMVNGGIYKWLFTYSRDAITETTIGPESLPYTNDNTKLVYMQTSVSFPADVVYVGVYRTVAGGSVFFSCPIAGSISFPGGKNFTPVAFIPTVASGGFQNVSYIDDAYLATQPTAPVANDTRKEQVKVTNIALGPTGTTARKLYRTVAGGSQLKLLATIADNTTTDFDDTTVDASLGANAPTTNTAEITGSTRVEKGLDNEFLYVYAGDGTAARKAAGTALTGTITIAHGTGRTDAGFHLFGFVAETISGYLTPPGAIKSFTTAALNGVSFGTVPTGGATTAKRHLVATRKVTNFNGNLTGYNFFFVPNATIENNTDTFLNNISFYDADLLDDASYLLDNYSEIPAGAVLTLYRNRLVLATTFDDISIGLVSTPGELEAISQIDGIISVPPDGNPITNAQELRDILYVTKHSRTLSFNDNGDAPSTWGTPVVIDNALGTSVHGIATVLDSGSSSVDLLIIATYQGISLFNGRYITPELSFKIENYWKGLNRELFRHIQMVNAPIQKELYIVLPTRIVLVGNYANGFDPKKIRWSPWTFPMAINTIAIANIDELILGADIF